MPYAESELTLAHLAVRAAKAKWNERRTDRIRTDESSLSFEMLFAAFKDNVSHSIIAESAGVSREKIRLIYYKYFRMLFGKTSRARWKALEEEKQSASLKRLERKLFADNPVIKKIVGQARKAGCTVLALPVSAMHMVMSKHLLVNGHTCSIRRAANRLLLSGMKRSYARLSVRRTSLLENDALVIRTAIPGLAGHTFVIPTADLRAAMPRLMKREMTCLYLPAKKLPAYRGRQPELDFWQYENAWHLLMPKKE